MHVLWSLYFVYLGDIPNSRQIQMFDLLSHGIFMVQRFEFVAVEDFVLFNFFLRLFLLMLHKNLFKFLF